jgi:hypothetical protein
MSTRSSFATPGFWRANGLSMALLALFAAALSAQALSGWQLHNAERLEEKAPPLALLDYLGSGHFISATFENWESEFLQMAMYVLLTVVLRQRGSAESRPLDPAEEAPRIVAGPTPWPARAGGLLRALYGHSLAIALGLLFALSFALHAWGSWRNALAERALQGEPAIPLGAHLGSAQFWFESFQNWQSEFLAVLALVVLSIWLRQKDSPQSKPVDAPHRQTGT